MNKQELIDFYRMEAARHEARLLAFQEARNRIQQLVQMSEEGKMRAILKVETLELELEIEKKGVNP